MGLDAFSEDDSDHLGNDDEDPTERVEADVNFEAIGNLLRGYALRDKHGVEMEDGKVVGEPEDFGYIFALMRLDVPKAELDVLKEELE